MPSKKRAAARKVSPKLKAVSSSMTTRPTTTTSATATTSPVATRTAAFKSVWTLPIAMLMLMVAAAGLWLAVRESSNAPQAATPAATRDVITPEPTGSVGKAAPVPTASAAKSAESAPAPAEGPRAVSITGCLQKADNGFVLKSTEGAEAPKSRSWKSGFLRRSSAPVDLQDASNASHLSSHVGQRVSVTGPLVDRQMQVQSLHRVAASCQ
jgi:hypothetical protein